MNSKERLLASLRLRLLVDWIIKGGGLTPEQQGCRERLAMRDGVKPYDEGHVNRLLERARKLEAI